jgi:hypothetical protein
VLTLDIINKVQEQLLLDQMQEHGNRELMQLLLVQIQGYQINLTTVLLLTHLVQKLMLQVLVVYLSHQ